MEGLIRRSQLPARLTGFSHDLVKHLERMERLVEVTKEAMDQTSEVYGYGDYKAITTLSAGELLRRASELNGSLTSEQAAALERLRTHYLERMDLLAACASDTLLREVLNAPLEEEGAFSRLLHEIFG